MTDHPQPPPEALNAVREVDSLGVGLAAWWCDSGGTVIARPRTGGAAGEILRSDTLAEIVRGACREWVMRQDRSILEPFPGCWMFPLNPSGEIRRDGFLAVMGLGPGALETPQLQQAMAERSIAPREASGALEKYTSHSRGQLESIRRVLEAVGLKRTAEAEERASVLDQFSRELADMYEHVNALFSLARLSARLSHPVEVMRHSCDQISKTLRFGWVAACFKSNISSSSLREQLILAGDPGCDPETFNSLLRGMADQQLADSWTQVLRPDAHPVAKSLGTELAVDPIMGENIVLGLLVAGGKHGYDPDISSVDMQLIDAVADLMGTYHQNATRHEVQREMFLGVVRALSASIDAKDPYTRGHSDRVALVGRTIAETIGLDARQTERVHFSGILHDVGKIGVPEFVLTKPGKLTDEEFDHIKRHPAIGHEILKGIPGLDDILPAVLHHHERWDGRGYPHGLKEVDSPLIARIIGLADAFDAMSSDRAYRAARTREQVLAEIEKCAGTQFDPDLASIFRSVDLTEFDQLIEVERRKAA